MLRPPHGNWASCSRKTRRHVFWTYEIDVAGLKMCTVDDRFSLIACAPVAVAGCQSTYGQHDMELYL
eukprot:364682-Chlamydomonas_euryale.AAC.12